MPSNRLKLFVLGALGVLVVVVVALGVVFVGLRGRQTAPADKVAIEVSDASCTPNTLSVAAGTPSFAIHNTSNRAIEWEILSGVMVVAERENIAPGFTVELTPRLEAGSYEMTCGLLSNPHGTLTVAATAGASALPAPPQLADLVAPTAEYRVYAIQSAEQLIKTTAALQAAVHAGDLPTARTQVADAIATFGHLAPITHLFASDANPLSSGPAALPALSKSLAEATPGANLAGLADVAARATVDLGGSVHATTAAPREIIAGAGSVVADLAGGVDDPADAAARIGGVGKVIELFRPLTLRADKSLSLKLDGDLAAVQGTLGGTTAA